VSTPSLVEIALSNILRFAVNDGVTRFGKPMEIRVLQAMEMESMVENVSYLLMRYPSLPSL